MLLGYSLIKDCSKRRSAHLHWLCVQLLNPCDVTSTFEGGRQPCIDDRHRLLLADQSLAQRKYVRVVVPSRQPCDFFIPAQGAAHLLDAVRRHCLAIARSAEDDAPLTFAACDCLGCRADEIGIIDWILGALLAICDGLVSWN